MNAMDARTGHNAPAKNKNKSGQWSLALPTGEEISITGPAGGAWAIIRGGVRYAVLLSFLDDGRPVVVVKRRINPAKAHQVPSREQEGLTHAIWVPVPVKVKEML